MWDEKPVGFHARNVKKFVARFTGAGAAAPTSIANVPDSQPTQVTVARSGVGTLSFTLLDKPLGVVQNLDFWVVSGANNKSVQVAPPTLGSYAFTANVTYAANGTAVDVAAGEEIHCEITFGVSG